MIEQVESELADAVVGCYNLQSDFETAGDVVPATRVGALAAYLCSEDFNLAESQVALNEAEALASQLSDPSAGASMEQVLAKLIKAQKANGRVSAAHKKAAAMDAEVDACQANLDAANEAESAAHALGATGGNALPAFSFCLSQLLLLVVLTMSVDVLTVPLRVTLCCVVMLCRNVVS